MNKLKKLDKYVLIDENNLISEIKQIRDDYLRWDFKQTFMFNEKEQCAYSIIYKHEIETYLRGYIEKGLPVYKNGKLLLR